MNSYKMTNHTSFQCNYKTKIIYSSLASISTKATDNTGSQFEVRLSQYFVQNAKKKL